VVHASLRARLLRPALWPPPPRATHPTPARHAHTPRQLLWDLSRDVAFKRAEFLALEGSRALQGSSVLLTDIPGLEAGTPLNRVGAARAVSRHWTR
jgi:hypothetical protein